MIENYKDQEQYEEESKQLIRAITVIAILMGIFGVFVLVMTWLIINL